MARYFSLTALLCIMLMAAVTFIGPNQACAASGPEIDRQVNAALKTLYAKSESARVLAEKAKGILVFPAIMKAGFIVGGQYGEGALRENGKTVGYYNSVAASYGLQAGIQKFGYALFFMSDSAMKYLDKSNGWEIGTGPSIVIVDVGAAGSLTTTTAKSDIYAFFFSQKGLMAGIGLQGTKITRINK
jgi:lipid-binding SYLF domain-containing protein